jgi:hypothetical protein
MVEIVCDDHVECVGGEDEYEKDVPVRYATNIETVELCRWKWMLS